MHYQVSRNGQMYGPYTLEDLQRYLASGNVLPTDLAKSEEMADWVPVSQLITPQAVPVDPPVAEPVAAFSGTSYADPAAFAAQTPYAAPVQNAALAASQYPDAPNLHWGLYLLFTILTCSYFSKVMVLVQAGWLRRVQPNSNAMFFYIGMYAVWILSFFVGLGHLAQTWAHPDFNIHTMSPIAGILFVVRMSLLFVSRFAMSASLEEHFNGPENVGLRLNPAMTFFFGGIYFQAKLNQINAMKQAARYGTGAPRAY